jgi:hypothetical protein
MLGLIESESALPFHLSCLKPFSLLCISHDSPCYQKVLEVVAPSSTPSSPLRSEFWVEEPTLLFPVPLTLAMLTPEECLVSLIHYNEARVWFGMLNGKGLSLLWFMRLRVHHKIS